MAAQITLLASAAQIGVAEAIRIVGAAVFDHGVEDPGQFVGGGGEGRFGPQLGLQSPEPVAERGLGSVERLGSHTQGGGQPVVDLASVGGVGAAASDAVVRAQPQSRSEMLGGGKLAQVGADFAQESKDA